MPTLEEIFGNNPLRGLALRPPTLALTEPEPVFVAPCNECILALCCEHANTEHVPHECEA